MLDFKNDRLYYGELLFPPPGFIMERAVCTTYSLNLTAFLSIPVALFYRKNLDEKATDEQMDIFDAIQKTSDSITIYCQKGKIEVPEGAEKFISFIEDSILEVMPEDRFKSFHPKIWVIRYKDKANKVLYRFIVLSRNLTFDRSWDVAFCMEGYVTGSAKKSSKPITDYINHLISYGNFKESNIFCRDLEKTDFKVSLPFNKFNFHPIGFNNYKNPLKIDIWKELIIVSPFLNKETLINLANRISGKKYLFSRKEELDKIHLSVLKEYNVFAFSQLIVDGEQDDELQEDASEEPMFQNLHAKIFIGTTKENKTKWYIGSANCSEPAMNINEEFLIELTSEDRLTTVRNMLTIFLSADKDYIVFEEYNRESEIPVESDEYDFRSDIFDLLNYSNKPGNIITTCVLDPIDQIKYDVGITLKRNKLFTPKEIEISVAPYGWKGDLKRAEENTEILFMGMAIQSLSPFLIWRLHHIEKDQYKEFITKIDITLPDGRKQAIFRSIIQDKYRFIQFIQFLLGVEDGSTIFEKNKKQQIKIKDSNGNAWFAYGNMYEEMLIAASRDPDKLINIEKFTSRMKASGAGDLIPKEFNDIWEVFSQVMIHGKKRDNKNN